MNSSNITFMSVPGRTSGESPTNDKDLLAKRKEARKRFIDSMEMNYEKWHDGIGYDLNAVDEMTQEDRDSIVEMLSANLDEPWRVFEVLDHINTPKAIATINRALTHSSLEVRIAASRFAKGADADRERVLIEALEKSDIYEGLSQALDEVETFHPKGIVDALLMGLLKRGDSGAVNFAGMLVYIHGKADSSFDWNHRPLFLRFKTDDLKEREKAFIEICRIIEVDPKPYLSEGA
jgi:hypothetical protein